MSDKRIKILIISHNAFTTYSSMGMGLISFFSAFDKGELCHLYIYPTIPNVDKCNSYYRITDIDVLKRKKGRVIKHSEILFDNTNLVEKSNYSNAYGETKKTEFKLLLRDLMWEFSNWYSNELRKWIKEEKPTHIVVVPGPSKFIYDIALKISNDNNIPIIPYICDDYYFSKPRKNIISIISKKQLKAKMKELMAKSLFITTISDMASEYYSDEFKLKAYTFIVGPSIKINNKVNHKDNIQSISYLGNLSVNRINSLIDIGKALDEINKKNGTTYKLKIFAQTTNGELDLFKKISSIQYCGFVYGKDFEKELLESDLLLHVEAFGKESVERVKLSISTKIANSLASGNCLVAYGPNNVASIDFLKKNDCAFIIDNKKELKEKLSIVLSNKNERDKYINAINVIKNKFKSNQELIKKRLI